MASELPNESTYPREGQDYILIDHIITRWFLIYLNVPQQQQMKLNELTKRNAWLSLWDTSPWQAANSDECDVAWHNQYFVFLHASRIYF